MASPVVEMGEAQVLSLPIQTIPMEPSILSDAPVVPSRPKRRRWAMGALGLLFALVLSAVLVAVGVLCTDHDGRYTARRNKRSVPSDTARSQVVASFIREITLSGRTIATLHANETRAAVARELVEEQALHWLIHFDPLQLTPNDRTTRFQLCQRYALLTLWAQWHGETLWRNRNSSNNSNVSWAAHHKCDWPGVACDLVPVDEGGLERAVTAVNVTGAVAMVNATARHASSLPMDVGLLSSLSLVDWSRCNLTGTLPATLGRWTNLHVFHVASNLHLTGTLPETLGAWSHLQSFNAWKCGLMGSLPSSLSRWTNVSLVNFGSNQMDAMPTFLDRWTQLQVFSMQHNNLGGRLPGNVDQWSTKLTEFYADSNFLEGSLPESIGRWTSMVIFNAANNLLTGSIPSSIRNWTTVSELYLHGNRFTGTLPFEFCNFVNPTELVTDCKVVNDTNCSCCSECY